MFQENEPDSELTRDPRPYYGAKLAMTEAVHLLDNNIDSLIFEQRVDDDRVSVAINNHPVGLIWPRHNGILYRDDVLVPIALTWCSQWEVDNKEFIDEAPYRQRWIAATTPTREIPDFVYRAWETCIFRAARYRNIIEIEPMSVVSAIHATGYTFMSSNHCRCPHHQ